MLLEKALGGLMRRVALYFLYVVILLQFLGGVIAFYRVDPRVLFSVISLKSGFFLGLFILIHLLGVIGAILAVFKLRWGFFLSIAHQLLMVIGIKITTAFAFLTHDIISLYLFFVSSFGEYSWTYRWSVGLDTIFAQVAANTRVTYIGVNLIAVASAAYLWWAMKEEQAAEIERAEEAKRMRRAQRRQQRQASMEGQEQRRAG